MIPIEIIVAIYVLLIKHCEHESMCNVYIKKFLEAQDE